jgi:hypothetical protein
VGAFSRQKPSCARRDIKRLQNLPLKHGRELPGVAQDERALGRFADGTVSKVKTVGESEDVFGDGGFDGQFEIAKGGGELDKIIVAFLKSDVKHDNDAIIVLTIIFMVESSNKTYLRYWSKRDGNGPTHPRAQRLGLWKIHRKEGCRW